MEIPVHSKGKIVYATVDTDDYKDLASKRWTLNRQGYAVRGVWLDGKSVALSMHREVMNAKKGQIIDHVNRTKLDNRKNNLRFVSRTVNELNKPTYKTNKSGHRGVFWEERIHRWRVFCGHEGKRKSLGCHKSFQEAIDAYHDFVLKNSLTLFCCK